MLFIRKDSKAPLIDKSEDMFHMKQFGEKFISGFKG